jgi:hypothetical protein
VTASFAPPGIPASSSLRHTELSVPMTIDGENTYHHDFGPGVCSLQIFGNVRIISPATTHKDLVDLLRRSVAAIMIYNSLSSNSCHSGDHIIWREALSFTLTDEVMSQGVAKYLSTSPVAQVSRTSGTAEGEIFTSWEGQA